MFLKGSFLIGLVAVLMAGTSVVMANRVVNGDFEVWDEPPTVPDGWLVSGTAGVPATQVTGFDGTGHAVELATIGGAAGGLFQTLPDEDRVTGDFFISMDFAFDTATTGDRVFNPSIRDGTGVIRINIATLIDSANPTGPQDLVFHSGGAWNVVAADLAASNFAQGLVQPYRLEISGNTSAGDMRVTLTDLNLGTAILTDFDASSLWSSQPGDSGGINHFRLDTQRIDAPYRVDNIMLVPEPASLLLIVIAGGMIGRRRSCG